MARRTTQLYYELVAITWLVCTSSVNGQVPAPPTATAPPAVRILVPAYFYPGGDELAVWHRLLATAKSIEPGLIVTVVNPASGPGTHADPNYVDILRKAREANLTLIGYVTLSYAKRPAAEVRAEVDRWLRLYPEIQGIFFDEQPSGREGLPFVQDCLNYARQRITAGTFITNPGVICDPQYLAGPHPPTVCLFEHRQGFEQYALPDWGQSLPRSLFAVLQYDVPNAIEMRRRIAAALAQRSGVVFVTDGQGANPWNRLPDYWDEEVELIRQANRSSASPLGRRLRVLIETDAGGDPDDEQSLVRFLLYCNEWDVEGVICNRPEARPGENLNSERTGLAIVQQLVAAYGKCHPRLAQHDPRYPDPALLRQRTVAGYADRNDGVELILSVVDREDPRPVWYCEWGSDRGVGEVNMKRALDRVWRERGPEGYAKFKQKLRILAYDQFGEHTRQRAPAFPLWINTFEPPLEGKRWYHRFSALTARAGGFDLRRDALTNHGPLGALYPTNTTHLQKEGDSMTFLYLVPTGWNDPEQPTWGSWGGRYGLREDAMGLRSYWANVADTWKGRTHRDQVLARWAVDLQNDFRCRLDWCVSEHAAANHPPQPDIAGKSRVSAHPGDQIVLDASLSSDPDQHALQFAWTLYPEASNYQGPEVVIDSAETSRAILRVPVVDKPQALHLLLTVTDSGTPPLSRYGHVVVEVHP